jgi:DNA-binding NarL/FixJ family response regulator
MATVLGTGTLRTRSGIPEEIFAHQTVMVINKDLQAGRSWTKDLEKSGFGLVLTAFNLDSATSLILQNQCDLIFVDPFIADNLDAGFAFIQNIIERHPGSPVAIITSSPSMALCRRAARMKISDLLVKGPHLSISNEAIRLIKKKSAAKQLTSNSKGTFATGLFSSIGVTRGEMAVLEEFADGYPKQQDIAKRLNKDEVYIRKVFSRVYRKLDSYFSISNQAQLSHIMTLCSLFE